jgi:hypothetical protein
MAFARGPSMFAMFVVHPAAATAVSTQAVKRRRDRGASNPVNVISFSRG